MKLLIVSFAVLLVVLCKFSNGKPVDHHGEDPEDDEEDTGEPPQTLPSDFDFSDINISRTRTPELAKTRLAEEDYVEESDAAEVENSVDENNEDETVPEEESDAAEIEESLNENNEDEVGESEIEAQEEENEEGGNEIGESENSLDGNEDELIDNTEIPDDENFEEV